MDVFAKPIITDRGKEIRFVDKVLTPLNPKDIYYQNLENLTRNYFMMILVGLVLVFYMIIA